LVINIGICLFLFWSEIPRYSSFGQKYRVILLLVRNTALFFFWSEIPRYSSFGQKYRVIYFFGQKYRVIYFFGQKYRVIYFFGQKYRVIYFFGQKYRVISLHKDVCYLLSPAYTFFCNDYTPLSSPLPSCMP
jgi:hypothetical protein